LIVAFHGYRKHGHRVVAFDAGADGLPQGAPRNLVAGWEARGMRRAGTPVDIKFGADGALYLSEDRNGRILRLYYSR
jgi:glucose/arabinose dehydrogenase